MSVEPLRSWTREEYHRAATLGLFGPIEKLQLLDGQIVTKMRLQGTLRVAALCLTAKWLGRITRGEYDVRQQGPIVLSGVSEPEPDIAVVFGGPNDYLDDHPRPDQIALLVEVSDTTLRRDRQTKVPMYARAGVSEVWVVDVEGRRLETYREPGESGYRVTTILTKDKSVAPEFAPAESTLITDLLPMRR